MKVSYKNDLKEFYLKKSVIDEKMKHKLKKAKSLDKKREVIEKSKQEREEDKVDDDELNLLRKPFIRMTDYLKQIDDEIKLKYEQYNEFKLNVLYEHVNIYNYNANANDYSHLPENQLKDAQLREFDDKIKSFEEDIETLKEFKSQHILSINKKKEKIDTQIKDLKKKILERQQEYNETEDIEGKKRIYIELVEHKKNLFKIFRKNISIVNIESKTNDSVNKYFTIVIDYTPIKNNQTKLINEKSKMDDAGLGEDKLGEEELGEVKLGDEELGVEELGEEELGVEELGVEELGKTSPPSPQYRPSEHN